MSYELGKAYVQVIPSTEGIKGELTNALTGATSYAGGKSGVSFAGKFGKVAVKALGAVGIATTIGSVFSKGWDRMLSIDTAKAKLTALGNDSKAVKLIADNAMAAVKGTAYGMDAAMTTAASAVAAGIKPGQQLSRYLGLVGDAAAVAGISMEEMGSIFNDVAASGKVSAEEMNQLADRGIPIWQLLAKETGKSMDELRKAVTNGEIGINEFQNAIENRMGGAAKTIGSTTIAGEISNIQASLSRIGANFLGSADDANSFAGKLLPLMNQIREFMGKIEAGASALGQIIGSIIGPIMEGIGSVLDEAGKGAGELGPLKDMLIEIGTYVGQMIKALMPLLKPLMAMVMNNISNLMAGLEYLKPVISAIFGFTKTQLSVVAPILKGLMQTFNAFVQFVQGKMTFGDLVAKVGRIWSKVKDKITKPLTKAKNEVTSIISTLKNKFPFNIGKIIKMKLPKITLKTDSKSVLGKTITYPKGFSIKWNKKAMKNPYMFDNATLFGAGEAGDEMLYGRQNLLRDIREASSGELNYTKLAEALTVALRNLTIVTEVDGREVARTTAPEMRKEINKIERRANRALGIV